MRRLWQSILSRLAKGLGYAFRRSTRAAEPGGKDAAGPADSRAQHLAEGGTAGRDQAQPPAAADPADLVKQAVERAGGTGAAPRRAVREQLAALGITQPAAQHQAMQAAVAAGVVTESAGSLRLAGPAQTEPASSTSTTPPSTSSTTTQGEPSSLARLVADAVRQHGGDFNLANMARVREYLHKAGVQTRSHQDVAIREARRAGLVTGSALEGRHGVTPEELGAAPMSQDRRGPREAVSVSSR